MELKIKLRNYIDKKLKELKLTKDEFYSLCGFSRATYYNITANPLSMTIGQIDAICKTLNISYIEFSIVIGRINPLEIPHPMPISRAREILYDNKSLLKSLNINIANLSDAKISEVASVLDIILSWAFNK